MLVDSEEIDLEVKSDKTKYMVMCQNAGRCQNINLDNRSFRRVEEFNYLETNVQRI